MSACTKAGDTLVSVITSLFPSGEWGRMMQITSELAPRVWISCSAACSAGLKDTVWGGVGGGGWDGINEATGALVGGGSATAFWPRMVKSALGAAAICTGAAESSVGVRVAPPGD